MAVAHRAAVESGKWITVAARFHLSNSGGGLSGSQQHYAPTHLALKIKAKIASYR